MKFNHVDAQMRPAAPPVGPQLHHFPHFARCAIERLDRDESLRNNAKLDELLDAYAKRMGKTCDSSTRDWAHQLCVRRYGDFAILC